MLSFTRHLARTDEDLLYDFTSQRDSSICFRAIHVLVECRRYGRDSLDEYTRRVVSMTMRMQGAVR